MLREDVREAVRRLAGLPAEERSRLPGISRPRAAQSLAGALVGHTVMKRMGVRRLTICPWAVREGILLRRIEEGDNWWDSLAPATDRGQKAVRSLHLTARHLTSPSG
ncbi:hypothetical protein [Streptomyces sp. KL116D]|uniref:Ppx/GppA phosphatase family protein n=1 Tax=Streptomyces sp. KL116D TaxID=3045152 RepID=UPI0035575161